LLEPRATTTTATTIDTSRPKTDGFWKKVVLQVGVAESRPHPKIMRKMLVRKRMIRNEKKYPQKNRWKSYGLRIARDK